MNMMYVNRLMERYPKLKCIRASIEDACQLLVGVYRAGGKVLVCGNGGSCADADHITGELMKGFLRARPLDEALGAALNTWGGAELATQLQTPLPAINLCGMPALSTAIANDIDARYVYAQLTLGLAVPGDVFWGISTSGNAQNVQAAAITAKAVGAKLLGFTGVQGGIMNSSALYDVLVIAPEDITYCIQEAHMAIYHAVCLTVEEAMFG